MHNTLLLVAAGSFWICCIVGAGIWWISHRARRGLLLTESCLEPAVNTGSDGCPADRIEGPTLSQLAAQPTGPIRPIRHSEADLAYDAEQPGASTSSLRFPYPQRQWMAPCVRGRLPSADDFVAVQCQELFGDGISFHMESSCQAETLVISLGTSATMIFMLARVVSRQARSEAAPSSVLVECRFIRRVREGTGAWVRGLKFASCDDSEPCLSGTALA
jgi:hypothetical protein